MLRQEDLYLDSGYANIKGIIDNSGRPFIFMVGARGIGKTYGAVEYCLDNNIRAIFMRRTQQQCDMISNNEMCQVKPNYRARGMYYDVESITKGVYGVYDAHIDEENGKVVKDSDEPRLVNCALSTIYNIRGFDGSDYTHIFYDEFIPEPHARPIKNEGEALLQAYETINRNRELQGRPPLIMVCMANSNYLANPIFADLNLITPCDKTFRKGKFIYDNPKRGVCVINFVKSPISEQKRGTALYRFSMGKDFNAMALDNEFRDERSDSKSLPLNQIIPVLNVGELTVYRVKSQSYIYISMHHMDTDKVFPDTEKGLEAFRFQQWQKTLWLEYISNDLVFENYECEYLFKKYCGLKK